MTKAVSNRDICLTTAVLLWGKDGYFSQNFASHGLSSPPPPIQLGLINSLHGKQHQHLGEDGLGGQLRLQCLGPERHRRYCRTLVII